MQAWTRQQLSGSQPGPCCLWAGAPVPVPLGGFWARPSCSPSPVSFTRGSGFPLVCHFYRHREQSSEPTGRATVRVAECSQPGLRQSPAAGPSSLAAADTARHFRTPQGGAGCPSAWQLEEGIQTGESTRSLQCCRSLQCLYPETSFRLC